MTRFVIPGGVRSARARITPSSRTMARTMALACAAVAVTSLMAGSALADDAPTAADIAAARKLGTDGVVLANAGKCDAAIEKLARAERLRHAPSTLERLAECQVQVGRVVEGTENLERVVREPLPPNAPKAFLAAKERAKRQLAVARPKIAHVKIAVNAPRGEAIVVLVDGVPVNSANLDEDRPLDPGSHAIEASAPGFLKATANVDVKEGASESVALTLVRDPNAVAQVEVKPRRDDGATPPPPSASAPKSHPPNRAASYVALGIGVVGVGVGAAFGVSALSQKSDLVTACAHRTCPPSQQGNLDSARRAGNFSTVGFGVGGAALAIGVILFFTAGSSSSTSGDSPPAAIVARPYLDASSAGVLGTF